MNNYLLLTVFCWLIACCSYQKSEANFIYKTINVDCLRELDAFLLPEKCFEEKYYMDKASGGVVDSIKIMLDCLRNPSGEINIIDMKKLVSHSALKIEKDKCQYWNVMKALREDIFSRSNSRESVEICLLFPRTNTVKFWPNWEDSQGAYVDMGYQYVSSILRNVLEENYYRNLVRLTMTSAPDYLSLDELEAEKRYGEFMCSHILNLLESDFKDGEVIFKD